MKSDDARLLRTLHRERGTWRAELRVAHGERLECFDGMKVGDGWAGIVGELLESIAEIVGDYEDCPELHIEDIRSKNGMLHVRLRHVPEEHRKAVDEAIVRAGGHALFTCERCGGYGRIVLHNRRRRVACPKHEDRSKRLGE